MLSPTEQWTLHSFYEFTKHLTDTEFLALRAAVSRSQQSLPHRAGKAFAKPAIFTKRLEAYRAVPHPKIRKKGVPYEVRVLSEVNPEIDPKLLAQILIEAIKERSHQ